MSQIKICHVIGDFVNGGVESVIYNYFSHMDLSKFEVHIIGHGIKVQACADRFTDMGFVIHNITPKSVSFLRSLSEMKNIFQKYRFDVIHAHLTEWACVPMLIGWLCGVKVRINHSHMAEEPYGIVNKIYYGVRLFLGKLFATDYFACGEDAGRYLFGNHAVDSGKVTILPNAIDFKSFHFDLSVRNEIRSKLKLNDSTVVIGHVGRFFEQKNHKFLIEIFRDYHKQNHDSILLLFGDGELKHETEIQVKSYDLGDSVRFMGVQQNMSDWYKAMDIFVLPSLYEGLPVVGVEAQAIGLPCLFSDQITREIAISSGVEFLPINTGTDRWVDAIHSCGLNNSAPVVDMDRYDITKRANFLQEFYTSKSRIE